MNVRASFVFFVVLVLTVPALFTCVTAAPEPAPGGTFGPLTFADEFDGPAVDPAKWYVRSVHEDYWPETPWRRNYKKENAYVENGALVLRTVRGGPDFSPAFSAAMIATDDDDRKALFVQTLGRFEARVKFPKEQGHWCAFWLMADTVGRVDGSGRDGTEIDIMEKAWTVPRVQHALHWDGYGAAHRSADHKVEDPKFNDGDWHVFRVDWYPDRYEFFVDGTMTWRTDAGGVSLAPARIILSEEIGNFGAGPDAWGGGPISEAALPDYFLVDYVRVWAYAPPE